jgi:hypothetical protein
MNEAAVSNRAAFEQLPVAGENDTTVAHRYCFNFAILKVIVVKRIESGHAQQVRKPTQVRVGEKVYYPQGVFPEPQHGGDVYHLEPGKDGHAIAMLQ